jgi:hypothetical protein
VVMLWARDERNVVLVVFVCVIDDANDALLMFILEERTVTL